MRAWHGVVVGLALATHPVAGVTDLVNDVRNGWVADVRARIAHGADVNEADEQGYTPLHAAAFHGETEIARVLLEAGAKASPADADGRTPLHKAIEHNGSPELVRLLLEHGARVDALDSSEATPLAWALYQGKADLARLLVKHGAQLSPFLAAALGDVERLAAALKTGTIAKRIGPAGYPLTVWAACAEDPAPLRMVLGAGAQIDATGPFPRSGWTALHQAAFLDRIDSARLLLERGAPVDGADSTTPLSIAARWGHTEMCRLLIEHGADVQGGQPPAPDSAPTDIPLLVAAGSGHMETVQALLDLGTDVNARDSHGRTALHQAAIEFRPEVAKVLLERGADPAPVDEYGLAPALTSLWFYGEPEVAQVLVDGGAPWTVHLAAGMGRLEKLREFLDQGVSVDTVSKAIDADGWTPLHWAARCGQPEAAEFLLQHGAKVDARTASADTPLLLAAAYAGHEVAAVLLAHGADPNAVDGDNHPALSSAAARNYVEFAELLLDHGAKLNLKDSCGETPLTCAQKWGGIDMERLLKSRGAK